MPGRRGTSIRLPPGFAIDVWVEGVPRVRSLALGDDGTVYAGTYPHAAGVTGPKATSGGRPALRAARGRTVGVPSPAR